MSLNPNQLRQRRTESCRRKRQEKKKPKIPTTRPTMQKLQRTTSQQRTVRAAAPKVPRAPRVPSSPTKRVDKPQSFLSSALQRFSVAIPVLFMMLAVLVDCGSHDNGPPPLKEGTIQTLGPNDEIYFTDGVGSLAEQMSADGTTLKGSFAAYPYGVTRYDTSPETRKYAGTPYDKSVGLNQMGARSYAPDLGVWTSPDPVGLWNPERGIGQSFSHNNPYAYAANSPLRYRDRNGKWPTEWDWKDFREFARGVGDQIVDTAREIATTRLEGLTSGDPGTLVKFTPVGAAVSAAVGTVQTAHDVTTFGDDFAKSVFAQSYYETGRMSIKPALTAIGAVTTALGAKASVEGVAAMAAAPKAAPAQVAAKAAASAPELLPQFTKSTVDAVVSSARRLSPGGQITEGARAIAKKLGHAQSGGYSSAFSGVKPTQANAETIIRDTLENPARTFYGDKVIDVYNGTGQGVRFDQATNEFRGFLEEGLAKQ